MHRVDTESPAQRTQRLQRISRSQVTEERGPRAHLLEDEAASITLDPGNTERPPQERRHAGAAAQLRELTRQRGGREMRQPRGELNEITESLDRHHLAELIASAAEISAHGVASTSPSR